MPFSGIKVSITNFGARERDNVVAQLKQGDANYSPELYRVTTHLVGNRPGGNKYTHAKEWGLLIVHHDWVLDCLKAKRRLDERRYNLDTYVPGGTALASGLELQRQPSRTVSSSRGPAVSGAGDMAAAPSTSAPARQAASASIRGVVAPRAGDSAIGRSAADGAAPLGRSNSGNGPQPHGTAPHGYHDHAAEAGAAAAQQLPGSVSRAGSAGPPLPQAPSHPSEPHHFYSIPAIPPDDCYFLHWVRMWMVGCTGSEQSHVLAAVRESGATREPVLCPAVTHIVFGSILSAGDLAEVRQHLAEHREQVKLARLSWLYECVNRRAYVEPEGPYAMTVAQLLLAQGGAGAGSLLPSQANRGVGHRGRDVSPPLLGPAGSQLHITTTGPASSAVTGGVCRLVTPMDDYVPLEPDGSTRTMDASAFRSGGGSGVFGGLWFTLAAVEGTEEAAVATKLVRQGAGMIMSASTEKEVRDPQRRYAVCPFSLPQSAVDRLCSVRGRERATSEFERVPVDQRVTVAWLRACVARGELLPAKRETPLFRPLGHALPLPRFQGVVVAVSQYHMEQREVLQELISRLGGTYTEKLNKKCNYLVIQDASGEKFLHALKWGIPCVRADWVLESAYAGRPLDDQLMAFIPAGITPAEMEERRAAARRGGGGIMASQLGPTQRPAGMPYSQVPATLPARVPHGATQLDPDSRSAAAPPQRPPQPPPADRGGRSAATQAGAMPPPASLPTRQEPLHPPQQQPQQQPMAPPAPQQQGGLERPSGPRNLPGPPPADKPRPRPRGGLKPLIEAILEEDSTQASPPGHLPAHGPGRGSDQMSGQDARSAAAPLLGLPPYSSASAQPPATTGCSAAIEQGASTVGDAPGTAGQPGSLGTSLSSEREAPKAASEGPGGLPPSTRPGEQRQGQQGPQNPQAEAAAPERDDAGAMLLQFLDNNKLMPDMMCSQLDMPMPMPPPAPPAGPLGGEGTVTDVTASSMSSRDMGSTAVSLRSKEADGGGAVGGRRSRKRTAAAAVAGEAPAVPGKVGGLPGRRGRNDDEEEGLGIAMSQQVGYEAATAAPPPRTRSMTRGGRGGASTDAKENLIKAVQGGLR